VKPLNLIGAVLAGVLTVALAPAPAALADADPASDYLLAAPAFYPFQPATSPALRQELEHGLAQLKAKGLNLKVAIIGNPTDLGAVPNLFGKPQAYAKFLSQEISFNQPQPLLVVMPAGFGLAHVGPSGALNGLKIGSAQQSDGLTRSAILAVERLAQANGKPIAVSSAASGGSGSGGVSPLITFGAPALIVVLGALLASRIRRRPG
jgi:hypothetical protein